MTNGVETRSQRLPLTSHLAPDPPLVIPHCYPRPVSHFITFRKRGRGMRSPVSAAAAAPRGIKAARHPLVPAVRTPPQPSSLLPQTPSLHLSNRRQFHSFQPLTMPTYIVRGSGVLTPTYSTEGLQVTDLLFTQVTCKRDATPEQVKQYAESPLFAPRAALPMLTMTPYVGPRTTRPPRAAPSAMTTT